MCCPHAAPSDADAGVDMPDDANAVDCRFTHNSVKHLRRDEERQLDEVVTGVGRFLDCCACVFGCVHNPAVDVLLPGELRAGDPELWAEQPAVFECRAAS